MPDAGRLTVRERFGPTWTLLVLAPLIAEVLSGSTRLRALFVFPIEMCVWGGGAVLIRQAVRRFGLGWAGYLALAIALAIAEEAVIQQSSLAPLVVMLKGEVYARAFGVNYLYLLWALVYECVFVVFIPIFLAEMIFPARRGSVWMGTTGVVATLFFFVVGSCLAWYTWTHVARVKVFHQALYVPPLSALVISLLVIATLVAFAFGPLRNRRVRSPAARVPPTGLLFVLGIAWSVLWYALLVIAFGIIPTLPPAVPLATGLVVAAAMVSVLPRWISARTWTIRHSFWLCAGCVSGLMAVSFVGFQGSPNADLYFKIGVDLLAALGLGVLGYRLQQGSPAAGKLDRAGER